MTEEELEFYQDIQNKKDLARSARKQIKRGYKGKTLGVKQEHLSHKEWKKMNGEVKTYNLKGPMNWATFRAMPEDLQRTYLAYLIKTFGPSTHQIGAMLGVSGRHICTILSRMGLRTRGVGGRLSRAAASSQDAAWNEFCGVTKETKNPSASPESPLEDQEADEPVEPVEPTTKASEFLMARFETELNGPFNAAAVSALLAQLITPGTNIRMTIAVDKVVA